MRLTVRLFAGLRERAGTDEIVLEELPEGCTALDLKRALERAAPELGSLAHVGVAVGTSWANDARVLAPGDRVSLLPPVSGGRGDDDDALERGVFELSSAAIEPERVRARVEHDACGAVALFVGTTRATNAGKSVVRLDYEAFEAMTHPEMERIFERCRAQFAARFARNGAARMCVVHRVGTVAVGEPSVAIAVASPHRAEAFDACRYLIDELKKTLPIWKRELYDDGHAWVGERS